MLGWFKKNGNAVPAQDTLEIQERDRRLVYLLESGGYYLDQDMITISVKTKAADGKQFPSCALFCLDGAPVKVPLGKGAIFNGRSRDDNDGPVASAYFEFHAETVHITWTVLDVGESGALLRLEAKHEDVDYGDNLVLTRGLFLLREMAADKLWIP